MTSTATVEEYGRYLVVGPTVELHGTVVKPGLIEFSVRRSDDGLGSAALTVDEGTAELTLTVLDDRARVEVIDLLRRVAQKVPGQPVRRLLVPTRTGHLVEVTREDFVVAQRSKPNAMRDIYQNTLNIPWNYVPCEADVVGRLLARTSPGQAVLDLGCGFGKNAPALRNRGLHVIGIDVADLAVYRAREIHDTDCWFVCGSALDLPLCSGSLDAVLDVGCLHCIDDAGRSRAVQECSRVLRPGGTLVSRIFRRRDDTWLAAQPFSATRFGLEPDEISALVSPWFTTIELESTADVTYIEAVR